MKANFVGNEERYGVKPALYNIEFRSEGNVVYVTIEYTTTVVHESMQSFIDSWEIVETRMNKVRRNIDLESARYFTTSEAALFFGVHKNTVLNWEKKGRLRVAHRIGAHRRFSRRDCLDFLGELKSGEF